MQMATMQARMTHPAMVVPDAMQALLALGKSAKQVGVPPQTVFPGPGPQPGATSVICVQIVQERPNRPGAWTHWTIWMLSRRLSRTPRLLGSWPGLQVAGCQQHRVRRAAGRRGRVSSSVFGRGAVRVYRGGVR